MSAVHSKYNVHVGGFTNWLCLTNAEPTFYPLITLQLNVLYPVDGKSDELFHVVSKFGAGVDLLT